ncbi:tRNA modification GTPase [Rhodobacteraceae bacterium MBR-64]
MDTIFALASARGKAGVAVIRLSGTQAWQVAAAICGPLPEARRSGLRRFRLGEDVVDEGLLLLFEAGRSFTGEDVAEFHLHGSPAIVSAMLRYLGDQPGLRLAEPGEFSRRALDNGCLDLTQIEGLGELIEAETEAQRRQAMRVFSGELGARVADWRGRLIEASALVAASIDFADEEVPDDLSDLLGSLIASVMNDLRAEVRGVAVSERIRDGFEVAIIGAPNVGKSTLLNAIVGRQAALTSARAGTTRDVIEVRVDLDGLAVTFVDTAGLRDSEDEIESQGIALARRRAASADLRLFLTEGAERVEGVDLLSGDLQVGAKADLYPGSGLRVSGVTGQGVDKVLAEVSARLGARSAGAALITRERHRVSVVRALAALELAAAEVDERLIQVELVGEHLRAAVHALDVLIGRVDVEDVLGEVFARFCVGK